MGAQRATQWSERILDGVDLVTSLRSVLGFHERLFLSAAVEKKDRFQKRFRHWHRRLRLGSTSDISALGDGAAWIWNIVRGEFDNVRECLDIFHALEIGDRNACVF